MISALGGVPKDPLDFWKGARKRQPTIQSAESMLRGFDRIIAARDARLATQHL